LTRNAAEQGRSASERADPHERVRLVATGFETPLSVEAAVEAPRPESDQVRLRVEACGVCHRDLLDRGGRFPFLQLPITPGHEACGIVDAVGPAASEWRVGDRLATLHRDFCGTCAACREGETSFCPNATAVFGIMADGGYATYLVAPQTAFYRVPPDLPAAHAAILHCTFGTAFRDLSTLGRLRTGERVLITGANGGVGAAAVQIARRLGAEIVAIIRDGRHRTFVERLGAQHVVVDAGRTFHEHADVGRVDLALDTVGAPTFPAALRSLRTGGRIVTVGNVVAEKVPLNLGYLITYGISIIGGSGATRKDMAAVLELHRAEPFFFPMARELPLSGAEEAQDLVRRGGLEGRVVLVPARAEA
jgi:D-arabinose 1-dehydrogenase-like Zn-dependent alcohol dehydrogenase